MHSWEINKDEVYSQLPIQLKNKIPEFKSIWDDEDVYLTLLSFGSFLIDNFQNEGIKEKCLQFIEDCLSKGGSKTEDAIVIQVFHQLFENKEVLNLIPKDLKPISSKVFFKALEDFQINN